MTALVVKFPAQAVGEGGGVTQRRKERQKGSTGADDDEIFSQADEEDPSGDSSSEVIDLGNGPNADMDDVPSDEEEHSPEPIPL